MSTDNLIANSGFEGDANKIKDAAKKLADAAINAPYRPNPRIVLDTSSYQILENEEFKIAGPYTPKGYDEHGNTDFTVTSVTASLVNAPSSAYICDVNGNAKNDFSMNDPIYVRARKSDTNANFTLNVTASGNKLSCGLYGDNSSANQNFATIITDPVSVSESANISWNKDTGNLNIIKQDQAGNKISGVTFEIRDSSLQRVAVATTNSSGKIELNNISTGSYSITEISAPTGYIIDSASKSAVVAAGSTETINFTNNRAQRYK